MRANHLSFAGWPGGARSVAPEVFAKRDAEVSRQFDFLLRVFTPRTVFMDVGSADCELSLRAAGYVERVWCIDAASGVQRPPSNLRRGGMGGVDLCSIDVAFSQSLRDTDDMFRLIAPGGVWFIHGQLLAAQVLRAAGFSRVRYYAGTLRVPGALARIARAATTAAYK